MFDSPLQSPSGDALSAAQIDAIGRTAVQRGFPKNAIIVTEGDETQALFIIVTGRVKVYVSDEEGREVTLCEQGPGEYFGEMVLDDGPRSASVITLEPSRFLVVPKADLLTFIGFNPGFAVHLIRTLIRRARLLTQNVKNLALLDVYGRVAHALLELAQDCGGDLVITRRPTQQDLANRVGASREMVSKIMKDLTAGGYVRVERDRILIARTLPQNW
jgi:CRP/FNR family cyclic AMP-dependent transcriptional regulator